MKNARKALGGINCNSPVKSRTNKSGSKKKQSLHLDDTTTQTHSGPKQETRVNDFYHQLFDARTTLIVAFLLCGSAFLLVSSTSEVRVHSEISESPSDSPKAWPREEVEHRTVLTELDAPSFSVSLDETASDDKSVVDETLLLEYGIAEWKSMSLALTQPTGLALPQPTGLALPTNRKGADQTVAEDNTSVSSGDVISSTQSAANAITAAKVAASAFTTVAPGEAQHQSDPSRALVVKPAPAPSSARRNVRAMLHLDTVTIPRVTATTQHQLQLAISTELGLPLHRVAIHKVDSHLPTGVSVEFTASEAETTHNGKSLLQNVQALTAAQVAARLAQMLALVEISATIVFPKAFVGSKKEAFRAVVAVALARAIGAHSPDVSPRDVTVTQVKNFGMSIHFTVRVRHYVQKNVVQAINRVNVPKLVGDVQAAW